MVNRPFSAVLAVLVSASCVNAGILTTGTVLTSQSPETSATGLLPELIGILSPSCAPGGIYEAPANDGSSAGLLTVHTTVVHMIVGLIVILVLDPVFRWRFCVPNSLLPASPLLDGILKPS